MDSARDWDCRFVAYVRSVRVSAQYFDKKRGRIVLVRCSAQLEGVSSYKILSRGDCTTLDGVNDANEFRGVRAAFDTIGMSEESQLQVWQMLAAMLHLSNLEFSKVDHQQGAIAVISDSEVWQVHVLTSPPRVGRVTLQVYCSE